MIRPRRMRSQIARAPHNTPWPILGGIFSDEAETLVRVVGRGRRVSHPVSAGIQLVVHGLHGARGGPIPVRARATSTRLRRARPRGPA